MQRSAALVLLCGLALGACSGSSSPDKGDASSATSSTAGSVSVDLSTLPPAGSDIADTADAGDREFIDLLWEGSGAVDGLPATGLAAVLDAYSAVNAEALASFAAAPSGPGRTARAVAPQQNDAGGDFTGFLQQMGSSFSRFQQQLTSGQAGSQTAQFDKEVEVPGKDGARLVAKVRLNVTFSLVGSKASVRGEITGDLEGIGPDGVVAVRFSINLRAEASVTLCPDLDGAVRVEGTFSGSGSYNGIGLSGTIELAASGGVGDDAQLKSVDWRTRGRLDLEGSGSDFVEIGLEGSSEISSGSVTPFGKPSSVTVSDADSAGIGLLTRADDVMRVQYIAVEMLSSAALNLAQSMWSDGFCLEIRTTEDSGTVSPGEALQFTATVWHKFDGREEMHPIIGSLSGDKELQPANEPQDPPVIFRYLAPDEAGTKNRVYLVSTSRRGVARKELTFEVGKVGYRLEVGDYQLGFVNPKGGTCDLSKPWTMSLDAEGGVLRLEFTVTPSSADGRSGTVRVFQTVIDSDFTARAESPFRIFPVVDAPGAPEGSLYFEWGPTQLIPDPIGARPRDLPQLRYLLVPDTEGCAGGGSTTP